MAFIKVIDYEHATGRLKEIYDDLIKKRGRLAEVHKVQSLRPESIVKHMELYLEIMFSKSKLSRAEREMIAVIVSISNNCSYCKIHHANALHHYWKDEAKLAILTENFYTADITEREKALCRYAQRLTLNPEVDDEGLAIRELKSLGLSDEAILDATLVISYFNFVNRMVLGLGVHLERNGGQGYKY